MEDFALATPLGDEPLEEVHLGSAPLVRVIAQLRFPQLASMADGAVAHELAREVSGEYPLFEEAREVSLVIAGATISQQEQMTSPVWRLQTSDGNWLVTLGRGSLSLEALSYAGRRDFCDRLVGLTSVFIRKAHPPRFDRFGIRYINRVTDASVLARMPKLVRPEIMGAATLELPDGATLGHSLSEVQLNQGAHSLLVRCGVLPAGTTIDPTVPATNLKSWILDIDSAVTGNDAVPIDKVEELSADLAERAYRFFRYAVTREFLTVFEASP
jgi:uncharacterized protein (TIGR04255 family)